MKSKKLFLMIYVTKTGEAGRWFKVASDIKEVISEIASHLGIEDKEVQLIETFVFNKEDVKLFLKQFD